mmetsp:Transcript_24367/g.17151  ORF Transcript_24367/g.17151 Transcript_24367/m.17151 type:complete len:108 (-) Transcript_24367:2164-2487(-)
MEWTPYMQPINFIADYYGEKMGMYFAWLMHYTGWLLIPSVLGTILFIYQSFTFLVYGLSYKEAYETPLNAIYSIFIAVWATCFCESWKRKENAIANSWLMRDFHNNK